MAKAKIQTKKKLTNVEKKINKEIREDFRARGIIPPVKAKLNRKKFAKEVIPEFNENLNGFDDIRNIYEAINWMTPSLNARKISPEQVGILKLMKLAVEIKAFKKKKMDAGEKQYAVGDMYNSVVYPILKL